MSRTLTARIVVLCIIISFYTLIVISNDMPICLPVSRLQGSRVDESTYNDDNKHVTIIGDIHGDYDGFLEDLYASNITVALDTCEWNTNTVDTLFVQMGDIVDRGAYATEAYLCLQHLQKTVPTGSQVIRLIGNHELWWLEGAFHMANPDSDTPEKIRWMVQSMKQDIKDGLLIGSYTYIAHGIPILFTHAGIRPDMKTLIEKQIKNKLKLSSIAASEYQVGADDITEYINSKVFLSIDACKGKSRCNFNDPIFQAGPERGGNQIGGPFWTDYKVLYQAATAGSSLTADGNIISSISDTYPNYVQVVGHSAERGKIRKSANAEVICVDAQMYAGGRAFLTIDSSTGRFLSHEKKYVSTTATATAAGESSIPRWVVKDLTREVCLR